MPPPVMTSVPPPVNSKAPLVRINVAVAGIVSVDVPAAAIVSELMVVVVPAGTDPVAAVSFTLAVEVGSPVPPRWPHRFPPRRNMTGCRSPPNSSQTRYPLTVAYGRMPAAAPGERLPASKPVASQTEPRPRLRLPNVPLVVKLSVAPEPAVGIVLMRGGVQGCRLGDCPG